MSQLTAEVEARRGRAHPGAGIERKPASVAVHTPWPGSGDRGRAALEDAAAVPLRHDGVHVMPGKQVVELAVLATTRARPWSTSPACAAPEPRSTSATT